MSSKFQFNLSLFSRKIYSNMCNHTNDIKVIDSLSERKLARAGNQANASHNLLGFKAQGIFDLFQLGIASPEAIIIKEDCIDKAIKEYILEQVAAWLDYLVFKYSTALGGYKLDGLPLLFSLRFGAKNRQSIYPPSLVNIGLCKHHKFDNLFEQLSADRDLQLSDFSKAIVLNSNEFNKFKNLSPRQQIFWILEKALNYVMKLPQKADKTIILQRMVFGNASQESFSGMSYTRNPYTGQKIEYGRFKYGVLGCRYAVSPISEKLDISALRQHKHKKIHNQLFKILNLLEMHYQDVRYIEFTYEFNKLYILQNTCGNRIPGVYKKENKTIHDKRSS